MITRDAPCAGAAAAARRRRDPARRVRHVRILRTGHVAAAGVAPAALTGSSLTCILSLMTTRTTDDRAPRRSAWEPLDVPSLIVLPIDLSTDVALTE